MSRRDGWRLHGGATAAVSTSSSHGEHHTARARARARRRAGARGAATSAGRSRRTRAGGERHDVTLGERRWRCASTPIGETVHVFAPRGLGACCRHVDLLAHAGEGAAEAGPADRADARQGDRVPRRSRRQRSRKGQALAVMEAMKMEHTIAAPRDGTVAELLYAPGDQVSEGGELLRLAEPRCGVISRKRSVHSRRWAQVEPARRRQPARAGRLAAGIELAQIRRAGSGQPRVDASRSLPVRCEPSMGAWFVSARADSMLAALESARKRSEFRDRRMPSHT